MTEREQKFHEHFMRLALQEAERSAEEGEVPCGCVIIRLPEGYLEKGIAKSPPLDAPWSAQLLAKAHNQTESLRDLGDYVGSFCLGRLAFGAHGGLRYEGAVPDVRRGVGLGASESGGVGAGRPGAWGRKCFWYTI